MRRKPFVAARLGLLVVGACSTTAPDTSLRPLPAQPYARVVTLNSNVLQFQVAARQFLREGRRGPVVWLTGVSHVGHTNYFTTLQEFLANQNLVLFEGVSDHSRAGRQPAGTGAEPGSATKPDREPAGLQADLASAMGLQFQLEAIDYRQPNFRNSDLSVQDLRDILSNQPTPTGQESAASSFDGLMELMQGDSPFYFVASMALRFVRASPKLQALAKIALIETVGQIGGDPTQLRGLPADLQSLVRVLIERRNQKVLADLKAEVMHARKRDSLAVFYGAGHMADLEKRLRSELSYQPVQEVWFTAIEVDLKAAGITAEDLQLIRSLIRSQMGKAGSKAEKQPSH